MSESKGKSILSFFKTGSKLRNKIFIGVVLVAIIPFFLSGVVALYVVSVSHSYDVSSIEVNLVNQKVEEVRNFVNDNLNLIDIIFSLDIDRLITVLDPQEKVDSRSFGLVTSESGERVEFWVKRDDLNTVLDGVLISSPAIEEVYLIDGKSGREIVYRSQNPDTSERYNKFLDLSSLPQFKEAIKGGRYVSPVSFTIRSPITFIAAPVKNKKGEIVGVLAAQLNLFNLKKIFERTVIGSSGYVYLVDTEGNLIYSSDSSKTADRNLFYHGIVSRILSEKVNKIKVTEGSYKSFWGEEVIGAGRLLGEENFNWAVMVEWPKADANKVIQTIFRQYLFFALVVLLLTVFISVLIATKIVGPIKKLQEGAGRVAEGKFDEPINIKTKDEIEDLGAAFNEMMKGLKRLEELREEFVFVAAHELRTPVTAIQGYISFILNEALSGPLPPKAREFFDQIIKANKRLTQLVEDLLQIARSEAGRLKIEVGPIDVKDSIKAVLSELKPLAEEKKINFVYNEITTLPKVMADADRLKEIMINLVGNAIKYTAGEGTVTVSHEIRDNKMLITHIKDNGIGISKEAQKRLFEKFYRVQTEKTQKIQGTGLGLFIVKEIVERMQGAVWAESEEGIGSTFSFSLPLAV